MALTPVMDRSFISDSPLSPSGANDSPPRAFRDPCGELEPRGGELLSGMNARGRDWFGNGRGAQALLFCKKQQRRESTMPLLMPLLAGVPVLLGGGYVIYHLLH